MWNWVLSIEVANHLSKNDNESILILDLTSKIYDFSYYSKTFLKSPKSIINILSQTLTKKKSLHQLPIDISYVKKSSPFIYMLNIVLSFINFNNPELENIKQVIYPNMVEIFRKTELDLKSLSVKRRGARYIASYKSHERVLRAFDIKSITDVAYLVNTRFANAASVAHILSKLKVPTRVIEFGSNQEKFEIFPRSAQSWQDFSEKIINHWNSSTNPLKKEIGSKYFRNLRSKSQTFSWEKFMDEGLLPELKAEKKLCVFYATSQIEFVGTTDKIQKGNFQNQSEALNALLECLPSNEWQVILRKHPGAGHHNLLREDEEFWAPCKKHPHLSIIEGDSRIDSFTLAKHANLVAHAGSTIGKQITYEEMAPVISLLPSGSESYDSRYAFNNIELRRLLQQGIPIISGDSVLPFGYFFSTFGSKFQMFRAQKGSWSLLKK